MMRALAAACGVAATVLVFAGASAGRLGASPPVGTTWGVDAKSFRGQNGSQFIYVCPAGGSFSSTWGTDVYTDDSSVCTAAVHAGKITQAAGGTVTIEIQAGLSSYTGTARNGVTTTSYGPWSGSFAFVGATLGGGAAGINMGQAGWSTDAKSVRGQNGTRFSYVCPAGGTAGAVWGTNTYTDDSSVCTAAVHVGLISLANGGNVTIEIRPGQSSYASLAHNGITTKSYGSWSGSFVFPAAKPIASGTGGTTGGTTVRAGGRTWNATAASHRSHHGTRYRYVCPAGGQPGRIWGTTVYTDDTSVCTAAVHSGRIGLARGGTVTIEIRPGRSSYTGSTRHGVTSRSYGPWSGSFFFVTN